jgi:hypothetical protein
MSGRVLFQVAGFSSSPGGLVPGRPILVRPLQHVHVPRFRRARAARLRPLAPVLPRVLKRLQVPSAEGCTHSRVSGWLRGLAVIYCLSYTGCHILPIIYWLSYTAYHILAVIYWLSSNGLGSQNNVKSVCV